MYQEYETEYEEYKKKKEVYEASLTNEQKEDIAKMQETMSQAKEKKKLKAVRLIIFINAFSLTFLIGL